MVIDTSVHEIYLTTHGAHLGRGFNHEFISRSHDFYHISYIIYHSVLSSIYSMIIFKKHIRHSVFSNQRLYNNLLILQDGWRDLSLVQMHYLIFGHLEF